jgi:hypothetical protein
MTTSLPLTTHVLLPSILPNSISLPVRPGGPGGPCLAGGGTLSCPPDLLGGSIENPRGFSTASFSVDEAGVQVNLLLAFGGSNCGGDFGGLSEGFDGVICLGEGGFDVGDDGRGSGVAGGDFGRRGGGFGVNGGRIRLRMSRGVDGAK